MAVALSLLPAAADAGEATARGKKADIVWIDEQGARQQAAAREIVFGYYTRTYLKVPRDGKNFKDELREVKGIPLAQSFVSFASIDKVEFQWVTDPNTEASRLDIELTLAGGKVRHGSGTALAGASHPTSPYIAFKVEGVPHQIELNPLLPAAERAGKPQLVSMVFTL